MPLRTAFIASCYYLERILWAMLDVLEGISSTGLLPRRRELPGRPAGRELLVREPEDGRVHFLNATATLIWNCCDGETTVTVCAERLRAAFSIPVEVDVDTDIRETLSDFALKGLIETDEANNGVGA